MDVIMVPVKCYNLLFKKLIFIPFGPLDCCRIVLLHFLCFLLLVLIFGCMDVYTTTIITNKFMVHFCMAVL